MMDPTKRFTSEAAMADPAIHSDQGKARQLGRRYAQLGLPPETYE